MPTPGTDARSRVLFAIGGVSDNSPWGLRTRCTRADDNAIRTHIVEIVQHDGRPIIVVMEHVA